MPLVRAAYLAWESGFKTKVLVSSHGSQRFHICGYRRGDRLYRHSVFVCGLCAACVGRLSNCQICAGPYGTTYRSGFTSMFIFQALLNVGGVVGVAAFRQAAAFISYGGSTLLSSLITVGVLMSISRRSALPQTEHDSRRRSWRFADEEDSELPEDFMEAYETPSLTTIGTLVQNRQRWAHHLRWLTEEIREKPVTFFSRTYRSWTSATDRLRGSSESRGIRGKGRIFVANSHAPLEIAIAAGGTAGHINPALALAEELRERGHHVRFWSTQQIEGTLVPEAGFELVPIHVSGFNRRKPWTLISAGIQMEKAKAGLQRLLHKRVPLMWRWVLAHTLSYPLCAGVLPIRCLMYCTSKTRLPVWQTEFRRERPRVCALHFPGKICVLEHVSDPDRIVVTGNPVRRSVLNAQRGPSRHAFGVHDDGYFSLSLEEVLVPKFEQCSYRPERAALSCPGVRILQSCGRSSMTR